LHSTLKEQNELYVAQKKGGLGKNEMQFTMIESAKSKYNSLTGWWMVKK
jgi:hypothetical protein